MPELTVLGGRPSYSLHNGLIIEAPNFDRMAPGTIIYNLEQIIRRLGVSAYRVWQIDEVLEGSIQHESPNQVHILANVQLRTMDDADKIFNLGR
jgi:hypothetical protein